VGRSAKAITYIPRRRTNISICSLFAFFTLVEGAILPMLYSGLNEMGVTGHSPARAISGGESRDLVAWRNRSLQR
jgi:hypothetical protein